MKNLTKIPLADRVFLERVRQYFGSAFGNVIAALFGVFLIALVLHSAKISDEILGLWVTSAVIFSIIVALIESRFKRITLTVAKARQWVTVRMFSGVLVGMTYGISPFLFPDDVAIHHEMFIFIILSAMISVSSTGYSVMPIYYLILNGVTMVPLTIYLFIRPDSFHNILLATAILWQVFVLAKALKASKSTINAIILNEQLVDEIEEHKRTKEQLKRLATHDALTGLPNRELLMDRLDVMAKKSNRSKNSFAVMFLDLDGFKGINDTHGHKAGDLLLQEVARRLKELARESDTVVRLGGDEFILACSDIKDTQLETSTLAQRFVDSLAMPVLLPCGISVQVSASIGIAIYPDDSSSVDDLLIAADEAMYRVKVDGKNSFAYASESA